MVGCLQKLNHVGPVSYENFYSSLRPTITRDKYERFLKLLRENDCTTMGDWLRVYNGTDVAPFIEDFRKMAEQYYPDKVDVCKDAVGILDISMTYVLNKSLQKNKRYICHLCRGIQEGLQHCSCNGALKCGGCCKECQFDMQVMERCKCEKTAIYELLRTGMVGGPVQVFTRYREKNITHIRFYVYGEKDELIKVIIGYDANGLYLHCAGNVIPCDKETLAVNRKQYDQKRIAKFSRMF